MAIDSRWGKKTIDPPMTSIVQDESRKDEEVLEASGELVDKVLKEVHIHQKVIPVSITPPPFPQRLVKKTYNSKYRHFHYV